MHLMREEVSHPVLARQCEWDAQEVQWVLATRKDAVQNGIQREGKALQGCGGMKWVVQIELGEGMQVAAEMMATQMEQMTKLKCRAIEVE